mmetsp:Transcript_6092/g.14651  ORF Transcript_6092/g.14651 Transcript_6092/m.14651 type:complete len:85 (-) Transcript_6092:139-393(-)
MVSMSGRIASGTELSGGGTSERGFLTKKGQKEERSGKKENALANSTKKDEESHTHAHKTDTHAWLAGVASSQSSMRSTHSRRTP